MVLFIIKKLDRQFIVGYLLIREELAVLLYGVENLNGLIHISEEIGDFLFQGIPIYPV